jgi:hypothetical protein
MFMMILLSLITTTLLFFSSWIEKKIQFHCNVKNILYYFNLLYRASRDGNTTTAFHEKCINQGAIIVIVKICEFKSNSWRIQSI